MYLQFICMSFVVVTAVNGVSVDKIIAEEWNLFKAQYGKNYDSLQEEEYRFGIFKETKFAIAQHNQLFAEGKVTYQKGLNKFADLKSNEITTGLFGNLNSSWINSIKASRFSSNPYIALPVSVDWRSKGAVTSVKNQGSCGSCWAFSATGALEGQQFIKKRQLVSLSEQNLVDCSKDNNGCQGGWMATAFEYIRKNGGINTEAAYPYEAANRPCRYNKNKVAATVSGIVYIPRNNENQLLEAVALKGPIAVAINADSGFSSYTSGVYDNPNCSKDVNHGVLIVGYGNENGKDYWLVKNSWGSGWGASGYIKMARNKNLCGIADWAMYPLV